MDLIPALINSISHLIGINLMDPHAVPFAGPLVIASFTGFTIGFLILKLMEKTRIINSSNHKQ